MVAQSVIILLPGSTTEYLQSPCFVVPIRKEGLPNTVITQSGQRISVDWDKGSLWEISRDVRLAPVEKGGGTLLVILVE